MTILFLAMVFAPLFAGIYLFFSKLSVKEAKKVGIFVSGFVMLISFFLYGNFELGSSGFQYLISLDWITSIGVSFTMGMDGISLSLVLLTTILTFVTLIFVDDHTEKGKNFIALILLLQTTLTGVFVSLDFFLFYLFWELVLIPMYFMILEWGGPNRKYAAMKFFIYTHVGSFLMLTGFIAMFFYKGSIEGIYTLNIIEYMTFDFPKEFQLIVFPLLFLGFAFKLPLVPFHTWLPDAHVEAPTAGSMLLAGVMLKMGGYGLIRLGFGLFPEAVKHYSWVLALLGVISMLYGAVLALAQDDLKKMIAYSSVSHMGSVVLGLSAMNINGFNGAAFQLFAHGIISAMLFMVCGILQHSFHTRKISMLGGAAQKVPKLAAFFVFSFMASLGLPGLAGFVAELNVFIGAFAVFRTLTIAAVFSLILTAVYYLWALERAFFGELSPRIAQGDYPDITSHEKTALVILTGLILFFGILPGPLIDLFNTSNLEIITRIGGVN